MKRFAAFLTKSEMTSTVRVIADSPKQITEWAAFLGWNHCFLVEVDGFVGDDRVHDLRLPQSKLLHMQKKVEQLKNELKRDHGMSDEDIKNLLS